MRHLGSDFFRRKTLKVAQDLIGCYLCRKVGKNVERYLVTEVEAYIGPHDLASHSSKGRTQRTEVMYAEAGTIYVYMIYGMYFMLNIVTEEKEYPAAVLIRGAGKYAGPGRLARALLIDKTLNGKMAVPKNGLWFESREGKRPKIKKLKRVGVDYAGPVWAEKEYRFLLDS